VHRNLRKILGSKVRPPILRRFGLIRICEEVHSGKPRYLMRVTLTANRVDQ